LQARAVFAAPAMSKRMGYLCHVPTELPQRQPDAVQLPASPVMLRRNLTASMETYIDVTGYIVNATGYIESD
jgi:hypothetical protein